jgi:hypothetical protein
MSMKIPGDACGEMFSFKLFLDDGPTSHKPRIGSLGRHQGFLVISGIIARIYVAAEEGFANP